MNTKTVVTDLGWLIKAQEISETLATPHRLFEVDAVQEYLGQSVLMRLVFIECANTGCRSPLERFHCSLLTKEGKRSGMEFMVDLIEGLSDLAVGYLGVEASAPDDACSVEEA